MHIHNIAGLQPMQVRGRSKLRSVVIHFDRERKSKKVIFFLQAYLLVLHNTGLARARPRCSEKFKMLTTMSLSEDFFNMAAHPKNIKMV